MAMGVSPLRHNDEEVVAGSEVGFKIDGFRVGVFATDPSVVTVELFLDENDPDPDVLVLETAVLVEPFLFLSD